MIASVLRLPPSPPDAGRVPLYRQIADRLTEEIRHGRYAVGATLPSEVELAAQLGVSRGSLREALQILADAGIVERVRKLGTRVVSAEPQNAYVQRLNSLVEALGFGGDTLMRIDDMRDVAAPDEPQLRDDSPTGFWLQITGTRHLPGEDAPTTWARLYVNGPFSGVRPLLGREVGSVYKVIEKAYALKVSRLQHRITAIGAPPEAAAALGLELGAPALEVDAWLYSPQGVLIEFVRSIHNPARFSMEFATESTR